MTLPVDNLLSERIRELINKHGSLRAVSRVLRIDAGQLSRIKNGKKEPSNKILKKLKLKKEIRYYKS